MAVKTRGRTATSSDLVDKGKQTATWVRKVVGPPPAFNPQKEKETFMQVEKDFIWQASTSVIS